MSADAKERFLSLYVTNAWEKAMDGFFEQVDRISSVEFEITDEDRIDMVAHLIDHDTADYYKDWIGVE